MSRALIAALMVIASGAVSCSDIPTAPSAKVTVQGTVTDREGAGIKDAYLYFVQESRPAFGSLYYRAETDAAGEFQLEVPEGTYDVEIQAGYDNGLPQVRVPQFKVSGSDSRFNYHFTGTKLSGEITGPGGVLLERAQVTAISSPEFNYTTDRTVDGKYSILIPPGQYRLQVRSSGYNDGLPILEMDATISATDTVANFALTGSRVTATVTLGGSSAMAGARMYVGTFGDKVRVTATSRVDGTATLYLPDGTYAYTVYPNDQSIVGPESGYWTIAGDITIPIDFPGTLWNTTLRRAANNSVVAYANVDAHEHGTNRRVGGNTDALGRLVMIVRPNVQYDVQVAIPTSLTPNFFVIPNVSSATDSTFDLIVNAPVP